MIGPVEMGALLKKIRLSENLISHYLDFFFC